MPDVQHRFIQTNGIRMHVAEAGSGPLVVLLHGFPESWYSWRHQLRVLSEAGYHVVAPDQRGYGQTDRPDAIDKYSIFHLVGDVVGLLDALDEEQAVVVGHDWGAPVAWQTALLRPDRVRGVVGLSVPFRPRGSKAPLSTYQSPPGHTFYQVYFQKPGAAEADLERDVRASMRRMYGISVANPPISVAMIPDGRGFLQDIAIPDRLPAWIGEADIDFYTSEFERTGFTGGLNWYRNIDRNWELSAPWQGAKVTTPALYVVGDRDLVYYFPGTKELVARLQDYVPGLTRRTIILERCGHWTQQERSDEVNEAVLEFLRGLPAVWARASVGSDLRMSDRISERATDPTPGPSPL